MMTNQHHPPFCRDAASRVSLVFAGWLFFFGCVPTPNENADIPPKATDLHAYYMPQNVSEYYVWHKSSSLSPTDSGLFYIFLQSITSEKTSEGYSPVWQITTIDSLRKLTTISELYVSDSLVKLYSGSSRDSLTPRQILLHDTLRIGASWPCANDLVTSNGAHINIKAEVIDYYTQTSSGGKIYSDVYVVSYTSSVKGSLIPVEPEYQQGARLDRYYAKTIGPILDIVKDSRDSTIWTNTLVETRLR